MNAADELRRKEDAVAQTLRQQNELREKGAALRSIQASQYRDSGKSAELSAQVFAAGPTTFERNTAAAASQADAVEAKNAEAQANREAAVAHAMFEARVRAGVQALKEEEQAARDAAKAVNDQAIHEAAVAHQMFEARVRAGVEALKAEEQQAARDAADAKALAAALDPLAVLQERYNVALARARELKDAGRLSGEALARTEVRLAAELEAGKKSLEAGAAVGKLGLFGLKPYEVQNLSYQINDVVTGLASGQHLSQVVAQQGGQILQLFPKVGGVVLGALSNPGILAGVATFVALGVAIKGAADDAGRLRGWTAQLSFRSDGGSYNAAALADEQKQLQRLGASADDAKAALSTFLDHGISPDRLATFGRVASETAETLGIKLPEAATLLAEAFSGGYDAVVKLDDKLNFLTASQRTQIRTLFEQGDAQKAQAEALDIYIGKQDELARKSRGEWGDAVRSLTSSVHALFDALGGNVVIQHLLADFTEFARKISDIARDVDRIVNAAKIAEAARDLNSSADAVAAAEKSGDPVRVAAARRANADAARRLEAAQGNPQDAADPGGAVTTGGGNSTQAKQDADKVHQIQIEEDLQRLRDAGQQRLLTTQERTQREFLAGEQAARSATDAAVAAAERRRAVAHETATIEKESDARSKQAAADREKEIHQFEGRVIGAEGGAGKNPYSSASGYGQFTETTWLSLAKKVYPDMTSGMSRDQVLALRQNEAVARGIIDEYARENAKFLESFGGKVTAGNLYLAHFLGGAGAKAVLTAGADTPVDTVLRRMPNADAVLSGNKSYLRTDGGKGRYRTSGELQTFMAARMGDTGQAQTEGQAAIANLIQEATNRQNNFNEAVRHGVEDRQDAVKALQQEVGLYGTALIAAQRQKAITDAERELRQKAEDANKNLKPGETRVEVSPEQIAAAKDVAGALFDAQHAAEMLKASLADNQRPVDALEEQKRLLEAQAEFLRSIGENSAADHIDKQVEALTPKLKAAYDQLIQFYQALSPEQRVQLGIVDTKQFDNVIEKLQQGKEQSQEWGKVAGVSAKQIAQSFSSSLTNSITSFLTKITQGKNVFKSLGESVREFAASFIQSIAQMILQLLAYAAAVQILKALGVPVPSGAMAGVFHGGGIVGGNATMRSVSPAWFATAPRYHTGGIVGLAPDERPAVLKVGEEVLPDTDPRHRANAGRSGGGSDASGQQPQNITVINAQDPEHAAEMMLRTKSGERAVLNIIRNNPKALG